MRAIRQCGIGEGTDGNGSLPARSRNEDKSRAKLHITALAVAALRQNTNKSSRNAPVKAGTKQSHCPERVWPDDPASLCRGGGNASHSGNTGMSV